MNCSWHCQNCSKKFPAKEIKLYHSLLGAKVTCKKCNSVHVVSPCFLIVWFSLLCHIIYVTVIVANAHFLVLLAFEVALFPVLVVAARKTSLALAPELITPSKKSLVTILQLIGGWLIGFIMILGLLVQFA